VQTCALPLGRRCNRNAGRRYAVHGTSLPTCWDLHARYPLVVLPPISCRLIPTVRDTRRGAGCPIPCRDHSFGLRCCRCCHSFRCLWISLSMADHGMSRLPHSFTASFGRLSSTVHASNPKRVSRSSPAALRSRRNIVTIVRKASLVYSSKLLFGLSIGWVRMNHFIGFCLLLRVNDMIT